MKLNYFLLNVDDLEKTVKFYEDVVGLVVVYEYSSEHGKLAFLGYEKGGESLLAICESRELYSINPEGLTISFYSKEPLEDLRTRIIELGYFPSTIKHFPPQPDYFSLYDPNGLNVEITN